eukprot:522579-Rhodomonas_salina.6
MSGAKAAVLGIDKWRAGRQNKATPPTITYDNNDDVASDRRGKANQPSITDDDTDDVASDASEKRVVEESRGGAEAGQREVLGVSMEMSGAMFDPGPY